MVNANVIQKSDGFPGDLHLFVAGQSDRARLVEREVRRVLRQDLGSDERLEVIDVTEEPQRAEAENVTLTPALVYHGTDLPRRLVGNVHRREQILWLFDRASKSDAHRADLGGEPLSDLCPDGLFLVDAEGRILACNTSGREMLGLSGTVAAGAVLGLPLTVGPPFRVSLPSGKPAEIRVRATTWAGEPARLVMVRPDDIAAGHADVNEVVQSAIAQAGRATDGLLQNARDLTEINQDLTSFASRAAHDIVSPVRSARGMIQLALADAGKTISPDVRWALEAAESATGRVITLTEDLLRYARTSEQTVERDPVNLTTVARWAESDLKIQLEEAGGTCEIAALPTVPGVPAQMYQVFLNLIANAIKYRRADVDLRIDIFSIDGATEADPIRVVVKDNGMGFDAKFSEQIFHPFERLVENTIPGSGLGLATVKQIVSRHNGAVWATGIKGKGAEITFELPRWKTL